MRAGTALWAYLLFVFVGAALLAPWIAFGLQGVMEAPFRRIVNRCLLGLALIGIWPLIKALGFRSWAEIGLRKGRPIFRDMGAGLLIGTVLLGLAAGSSIAVGVAAWDPRGILAKQIIGALLSAVVVAFLEEILFRGAIFTALRRTWNDAVALWASSGIYAIMHFFARPADPARIEWYSGFTVLGGMLRGFTEFQTVVPGFLSLTLLGVIFALAFKKTGVLWLPMGIHAALIFWVKLFGSGTNPAPEANVWFWGTEKLVDGWFCFILLSLAVVWFSRRKVA
jgi:uncharacterized protein